MPENRQRLAHMLPDVSVAGESVIVELQNPVGLHLVTYQGKKSLSGSGQKLHGCMIRGMASAGHILSVSYTPVYSVFLGKRGRLSQNSICRARSQRICTYFQKRNQHTLPVQQHLSPLFSVAPMMDWTDNHYRTLARLISKHAWLYTEMIAAETIVHQTENLDKFLAFNPEQHPIVLQIGGNKLDRLARATELASPYGYDEINLNCGCPSSKVAGHGCFGVSLMLEPKLVAEAMSVISANCDVPVSVKCRIGVDDHDSYNELCDFISEVSANSPTKHFIIHSRKALLNGISPADNRKIPPLKYEFYYALLRDFPDLMFTINGGIKSIDEVNAARREGAHGVMVGRAAYNTPWHALGLVDTAVYGAPHCGLTRRQVLEQYQVYGDSVLGKHGNNRPNIRDIAKPTLGLFHSAPGNGLWKRKADEALRRCTTVKSFFEETLDAIPDWVLDETVAETPSSSVETFAKSKNLLPPPYTSSYTESEQVVVCA